MCNSRTENLLLLHLNLNNKLIYRNVVFSKIIAIEMGSIYSAIQCSRISVPVDIIATEK